MKKNNDLIVDGVTAIGAIIGIIAIIIVMVFIMPWVAFWCAYLGGWIAKVTIGKYIVAGFKLFGIAISIDKIPLVAGFLGWFGSFFKRAINDPNSLIKNDK